MPIKDPSPLGEPIPVMRLSRSDLLKANDGTFLLPVTLEVAEGEVCGYATLSVDEAARLHAQLHRHLTSGWALTETEKASRETGEIYQVGGSDRLP